MKNCAVISMIILIFVLVSCQIEPIPDPDKVPVTSKKETIKGVFQKGSFEIGTSITIIELDSSLAQTGRNFSTQINSNNGNFSIKNIILNNDIIEIKADGFYFNEVSGTTSENKLTLYALSNLKDTSTVNVNVLSYLEKERIEYLVENGNRFEEAKKQAQKEVLSIFEVEKDDIDNSEHLDIAKDGEDNAILLAISIILQGKRNVAELSELLAKISNDIRTDGILDDQDAGSQLINDARMMNLPLIRNNIENKYSLLGESDTIPDFESIVANFIAKTDFEYNLKIKYPRVGKYGISILSLEDGETIASPAHYSLKALLPSGFSLRVRVKQTSVRVNTDWFYATAFIVEVSPYEVSGDVGNMVWTTKENVTDADNRISFEGQGTGVIQIYENDTNIPTRLIHFNWNVPKNPGLVYPVTGKFGKNIFALSDQATLISGQTYSLNIVLPKVLNLVVEMRVLRTSGSGTMEFNNSLVENWSAGISDEKNVVSGSCFEPSTYADMPIVFKGTGECTVEVFIRNGTNTVVLLKHFKW